MNYFYTYVLQSLKDRNFHVGYTNNLVKRIEEHNKGKVASTKNRVPVKIDLLGRLFKSTGCYKKRKIFKDFVG